MGTKDAAPQQATETLPLSKDAVRQGINTQLRGVIRDSLAKSLGHTLNDDSLRAAAVSCAEDVAGLMWDLYEPGQ